MAKPGGRSSRFSELAQDNFVMCSGIKGGGRDQDLSPIPGRSELLNEIASGTKLHPWTGAIQALLAVSNLRSCSNIAKV